MKYESTLTISSKVMEGVRFTIARMSFGRRIELTRRIRDLVRKMEFLEAGDGIEDKVEATLLANQIEKLYLEWGLKRIEGLEIDDAEAGLEALITNGPEALSREIVSAIKSECGLSEEERKN